MKGKGKKEADRTCLNWRMCIKYITKVMFVR